MAENTLDVRLLHAAKTLDDWNNVTTIPKLGEVCLEIQGNTPPLNYKIKIGDGSSTYAALPYFGTVVNTSGNASVVVVDTVTDGSATRKVLKFYKFTLTTSTVNGVTTITPTIGDLILTVQEGDGINFSTNTTDTLVNVELEAATADTAQTIADGGTFTTITKDSNNRATKYTTFTLPSITNKINTLDVADNTVITAEWDSTNKQIKLYYVKETNGIVQKGSLAYTINATDIAPVQNITTTDTGNSGLEITTSNNVKDVHHKAVTQNIVDNSSVVGEKELNVITNVEVDSYGHITGYTKDKSTNLVAADIKAPVKQTDNTTWNHRITGGDINIGEDTAKISVLKGNTIVWNQLVNSSASSVTLTSGNKYYTVIGGTKSIQTGAGTTVSVTGGTDIVIDLTKMFGSGNEPSTVAEFEKLFPNSYYSYNEGELVSLCGYTESDEDLYVDMGLPNGLLWAKSNIDVTQANGFAASPFQYGCTMFSWGNVEGHNTPASGTIFDYYWGDVNAAEPWYDGQPYGNTKGNTLAGDIPVGEEFDAARANLGSPWRMPTTAEFDELFEGCIYIDATGTEIPAATTDKRVTVNGIVGLYLQSKTNGNRLFFSASGYGIGSSWYNHGAYGGCWSASFISSRSARSLYFNSGGVYPQNYNGRYDGFAVRPVIEKKDKFGIKSTGINQWDEEWEKGYFYVSDGILHYSINATTIRSKNYIPVFPNTAYFGRTSSGHSFHCVACFDVDKNFISIIVNSRAFPTLSFTTPSNCHYIKFYCESYNGDYQNDVCINLSDPSRNGTYEPYKESTLDLSWIKLIKDENDNQLFPNGLLSAGSAYDEVTATKAIKRIGVRVYQSGDENDNTLITDKTNTYYPLTTSIEVDIYPSKNMSYSVNDLGTEIQLPINPSASTPITAPFVGIFQYLSNFKDTVLDLIDIVNNARNPVKGVINTNQTVDKLAIYDSAETVKSSNYSPSNATIVESAADNDIILPSVETIVNYVNSKISSALTYKGVFIGLNNPNTSSATFDGYIDDVIDKATPHRLVPSTGDMYIVGTSFTVSDNAGIPYGNVQNGTYQAGDFFIWNGTSWDIVSGTTSVVNNNPTLTPNGNTYQVGTVDGIPLQVTTPNLTYSSPSLPDGQSIDFIDTVSQTNGLVNTTKKAIPTARTIVNSINYDILVPPSTSLWPSIYAPTTAGTAGQFLKSTAGTPIWATLGIGDLGLFSKSLKQNFNGQDTTLGNIIRNSNEDLNLPAFYAPLDVGTSYNLLMSNGSGAPSWTTFLSADNGYLKKTANGGWSLDPYGGGAKESVMNDGSVIVASSSATAGLRKQTGPSTYEYQKISFAAITNDTATGNNAVTIILNGNFN